MTSDLRDLYQELILDHCRAPRNRRIPQGANRRAEGYNPLCGDKITVHLRVEGQVVEDVGFEGNGCAISTASASMMTESLKGKTLAEAEALFGKFHGLLTGKPEGTSPSPDLGKLAVFSGVREFPIRVKCATLAWHTVRAAFDQETEPVTTE